MLFGCRSKVPTPAKAPGFEAFVAGTGALGPGMTEAQIVRVFGPPAQKTEKDRFVTRVFALNGVAPGAAEVQLMGNGFVHAVFTRTDSGAAVPAVEAAAAKRIATGPLAQKAVM